jgi:hypothetical protein
MAQSRFSFLSDVLAGAAIGAVLAYTAASIVLWIAPLQHRRIVPQQRPAHDLDGRVSLLQKRIVESL